MRYRTAIIAILCSCALSAKDCVGTIEGRVERAGGEIEYLSNWWNGVVDTVVLGPLDSLFISGRYYQTYCQFPYGTSLVIDHGGTQTIVPSIPGMNYDRPFIRLHDAGHYHVVQSVTVGWFDANVPRDLYIISEEVTVGTPAIATAPFAV